MRWALWKGVCACMRGVGFGVSRGYVCVGVLIACLVCMVVVGRA